MKRLLFSTLALAGAFAAAGVLRYALVEPEVLAHACGSSAAPWWCAPRAAVIATFASGGLAVASIAAALLAILTRSSAWALGAACLGAAGLVLYAYESGAVALLTGLLVLARTAASSSAPG